MQCPSITTNPIIHFTVHDMLYVRTIVLPSAKKPLPTT